MCVCVCVCVCVFECFVCVRACVCPVPPCKTTGHKKLVNATAGRRVYVSGDAGRLQQACWGLRMRLRFVAFVFPCVQERLRSTQGRCLCGRVRCG